MSLETIINKIKAESQEESQAILSKAKAQAEAQLAEVRKQAETARNSALEKGKKEAQRHSLRLVQSAELQARKELLKLKQEIVEEVFNAALAKLTQLPTAKYKELIQQMLLNQPLEGNEQIIVAAEDKKYLGDGFLSQINQALKKKQGQKKAELQLIFDKDLPRGGFILRRNMVEDNNSFSGLLRARRDELELKVAQMLFEE